MKYIILILVAGLIIFVKPWRMSLEESIFSPAEDTTLLSSTLSSDSLMLFLQIKLLITMTLNWTSP